MAGGQRQDLWLVTAVVDGTNTGVWDKFTGGDVSSANTKYRPGGGSAEVDLGGATTIADLVISRLYVKERDHAQMKRWMAGRVGRAPVTVSMQPLDTNFTPWGPPIVRQGTLSKVNPPDSDSTGTGASMIELTISAAGTVS